MVHTERLTAHGTWLRTVAFSPNGSLLAPPISGYRNVNYVDADRYVLTAIWVNERINGLTRAVAQATTRGLGGMSVSGARVSPSGRAWVRGAIPTVPFHRTACTHGRLASRPRCTGRPVQDVVA
jgi:hypothetical protein